jgi:hypothetical protein
MLEVLALLGRRESLAMTARALVVAGDVIVGSGKS